MEGTFENFNLRLATVDDCKLLYDWANDPVTRQNSFNTEKIEYTNHCIWFEKLLADSSRKQYIFMKEQEPVGQLRLDFEEDSVEIGYSIGSAHRGKGYGKLLINCAFELIKSEYPYIKKIVAKVKPENKASGKCFDDNDFLVEYVQFFRIV